MGQGAMLRIYNGTPMNVRKTQGGPGYQMNAWGPPDNVNAKSAQQFYFEFNQGFGKEPGDDKAEVWYNLDSTSLSCKITASGSNDTGMFYLNFQLGWSNSDIHPSSLPYYIFWHSGMDKWKLIDHDSHSISDNIEDGDDGKYQIYELKLVQIRAFCKDDQEAINVGTALVDDNQSSQVFQSFINRVNNNIK
jgi:hypothetical protein